MTRCRSCQSPIDFVLTTGGKWMPVEVSRVYVAETTPEQDGAEKFVSDDGEVVSAVETTERLAQTTMRRPHWATCPGAKEHRRPRRPPGRNG